MIPNYQHVDWQGQPWPLPCGKVVCIGQNYHDHIVEMGSKTAPEALFFIKPNTALVPMAPGFAIPVEQGAVHHELELALLIGQPLRHASPEQAMQAVVGYGLALDLTLRDVQACLKQLGRPWEIAKGFDGACPISPFVPAAAIEVPDALQFSLWRDGQLQQQGAVTMMIRPMAQLLSEMSAHFSLLPGDVVLTGTPAGVGPLVTGQDLVVALPPYLQLRCQVHAASL